MGAALAFGLLMPIVVSIIGLLITYLVLYNAIKAGVAAGISTARIRLPQAPQPQATSPGNAPAGFRWVLVPDDAMPHAAAPVKMPDMRAD